jgi:SAM-dependent methyltransferase
VSRVNDEIEFWESRYLAGTTPWDFNGVPASLSKWLATVHRPGRVLVPGCGSGYELKAFHDAGWDVTGIDYAPAAVARARRSVPFLGDKVVLGNFFTEDFGEARFDLIYERTFLCALSPRRWPAYVERMRALLVPGGELAGFFFFGEQNDPPPYPLTATKQEELFSETFVLATDEEVFDSLPLFAGRERWQIWRRRSVPK